MHSEPQVTFALVTIFSVNVFFCVKLFLQQKSCIQLTVSYVKYCDGYYSSESHRSDLSASILCSGYKYKSCCSYILCSLTTGLKIFCLMKTLISISWTQGNSLK